MLNYPHELAHMLCGTGANCCFWIYGHKGKCLWLSSPPAAGPSLQSPAIQGLWSPVAKLSVVPDGPRGSLQMGRDARDATSAPSPCQNRTKWAWKCAVLHAGVWWFWSDWAGALGPSGGPSWKGFLWIWVSLVETSAQAEVFKWNRENICGNCFWSLC